MVESPRYLFIAGGIGITPILPMIRAAEAAGADWRAGLRRPRRASMAFLDELAALRRPGLGPPPGRDRLLDLARPARQPRDDTKVYCCGPEPLLAAVEQHCAHWPQGRPARRRFVAKPLTEPVLTEAFEVHLAHSELTLTVPPEQSILEVIEEAGVGVLSSCGEGTCGTCETTVLEGVPDHRDSVLDQTNAKPATA